MVVCLLSTAEYATLGKVMRYCCTKTLLNDAAARAQERRAVATRLLPAACLHGLCFACVCSLINDHVFKYFYQIFLNTPINLRQIAIILV